MKNTPILQTLRLTLALCLSFFALVSCDSDSSSSSFREAPDNQTALPLKVGSTIDLELNLENEFVAILRITILTYNTNNKTGEVKFEAVNGDTDNQAVENVKFSYIFEGDNDVFVLEEFVLDETEAVAKLNEILKDKNDPITIALGALGNPPTIEQLDALNDAVEAQKAKLGFTIDFPEVGGPDLEVFLVRKITIEKIRSKSGGQYTVSGPRIGFNETGTEIELKGVEDQYTEILDNVVITL